MIAISLAKTEPQNIPFPMAEAGTELTAVAAAAEPAAPAEAPAPAEAAADATPADAPATEEKTAEQTTEQTGDNAEDKAEDKKTEDTKGEKDEKEDEKEEKKEDEDKDPKEVVVDKGEPPPPEPPASYPKIMAGELLVGVEWSDREAQSGCQLFCMVLFIMCISCQFLFGVLIFANGNKKTAVCEYDTALALNDALATALCAVNGADACGSGWNAMGLMGVPSSGKGTVVCVSDDLKSDIDSCIAGRRLLSTGAPLRHLTSHTRETMWDRLGTYSGVPTVMMIIFGAFMTIWILAMWKAAFVVIMATLGLIFAWMIFLGFWQHWIFFIPAVLLLVFIGCCFAKIQKAAQVAQVQCAECRRLLFSKFLHRSGATECYRGGPRTTHCSLPRNYNVLMQGIQHDSSSGEGHLPGRVNEHSVN